MGELFANAGNAGGDKPKDESKNEEKKVVTPTEPKDHTKEDKTVVAQTKPSAAPASLTPAAPLATQTPAPANEKAVEGGQASTNPAQGTEHDTHALAAEADAQKENPFGSEDAPDVPDLDEGDEDEPVKLDPDQEMAMLKTRARLMGISHSNNIGLDSLREKIAAKMAGDDEPKEDPEDTTEGSNVTGEDPNKNALYTNNKKSKAANVRQYLQQEQMKLIRLRITNLDPKKKDLKGEIMTVANAYIGTIKKFIPFGEATDEGYHVPYCLYKQLVNRKFLDIATTKGPKGETIVKQRYVREFALEVLPALTQDELAKLSAAQLSRGGVE